MRRPVLIALALIAACSDDRTSSYNDFQAAEAIAQCDWSTRCGLFTTVTACRTFGSGGPARDWTVDNALAAGTAVYDEGRADHCIDVLNQLSCATDLRSWAATCGRVVDGTLAAGATCASNVECQSGACSAQCAAYTCCAGTCAADANAGAVGEACWNGLCDDGWCATSGSGQLECFAFRGSGGACDGNSYECEDGFSCVSGVCQRLPGLGSSCAATGACAEDTATCGSDYICEQLVLPGNPCTADSECAASECDSGVCTVPTLGQACHTDACTSSVCVDGTCVAAQPDNTSCSANGDCLSGTCDLDTGLCITPPACP